MFQQHYNAQYNDILHLNIYQAFKAIFWWNILHIFTSICIQIQSFITLMLPSFFLIQHAIIIENLSIFFFDFQIYVIKCFVLELYQSPLLCVWLFLFVCVWKIKSFHRFGRTRGKYMPSKANESWTNVLTGGRSWRMDWIFCTTGWLNNSKLLFRIF